MRRESCSQLSTSLNWVGPRFLGTLSVHRVYAQHLTAARMPEARLTRVAADTATGVL
jgi:hypothetical protein